MALALIPMRRRRVIIGMLALMLCGILAVVFWPEKPEPIYKGKKLSEWAEMAGTPNSGAYMRIEFLPAPHREAFEAVGSRGIPFYLEWVGYNQSSVIRARMYIAKQCDQRFGCNWKLQERM